MSGLAPTFRRDSARLRVAVVGCGVAGSILAQLLAREPGVELHAFERAGPDDQAEAGTGLNVGPNALKALDAADPALAAELRAVSLPWRRWRAETVDGAPIFDFALEDLADGPGIRIRWSELYRHLRAPLAGRAAFGHEVKACGHDPAQPGTLFLEHLDEPGQARRLDGIDLLVVTDGRYSPWRPQFAGPWTPHHVGVAIYRLLVPDTSHGLIDDYAWWFRGPNRLLAFRVPQDHIYIAGSFPIDAGGAIPPAMKTAENLARAYLPASGAPSPAVRWMVDQLVAHADDIHWARLQETPPLFHDASGQVLFLGDAAHGMVPTLGQGATQAVEDACSAARHIAAALHSANGPLSPQAVAALTEAIARERTPRVRWVMDFSREATAAMLQGADAAHEMRQLRSPARQTDFRRLWAGVPTA